MPTSTNLTKAVASGVAYLNEIVGEDWPDLVDPATLDMRDCHQCVLGQLAGAIAPKKDRASYSSWRYGSWGLSEKYALSTERARNYGFTSDDDFSREDWATLEKQWRQTIQRRKRKR